MQTQPAVAAYVNSQHTPAEDKSFKGQLKAL